MKESLPFPFLKKTQAHRKHINKNPQNFILFKKVLCLECSIFWNTMIHNSLIYPIEAGEQKKEKDNIALMEWYGNIRGEIEVVHLVMFSC